MAVVVFDLDEFRAIYPRFTSETVTDAELAWAFAAAAEYVGNTTFSPVPYDPKGGVMTRKILLFMLTCHFLALGVKAATGQVGSTTAMSASTSSLSMSFQVPKGSGGEYFAQTECGQAFWQFWKRQRSGGRYYACGNTHPWG